jgi:ABC-type Fe3+-siderophore transport system permease subunit
MKTENQIKRYTLIALLIVLLLFTIFVASVTYRYYGIVARGILGIVMWYLLYFFGRYSKIDVSLDTLLLVPKKGKYLISAFIGGLISYWATMQIIEMILFFWNR